MATATAAAGDRRGRPWWITLVMGIAAVIFGGLLLFGEFSVQMRVYDLLVTLLGIWWLVDGIVTIVHLFTDRTRWGWNLFIGIVSIIAGLAATEVDGIAGMSGGIAGGIAEMLGRKNFAKGVKVEVGEKEAAVDLYIIVKYGEIIGRATQDIAVGQHVHVHNLESCRGRGDK